MISIARNNLFLSVLLNFLIWGSGYIYKGERAVFGWLLILGYILVHWYALFVLGFEAISYPYSVVLLGHIIISMGLAYDVSRR
ncbi:MAG TPA: hypothetical protein ENI19_00330 [Candidatus Nealsonbacteria bacterium]|nr:hypothetical protein [Candidatus Nealsonbacteria bacterium]HEB46141.1 hypothetical protein [Candidatus Nealsonbacteria bacterium]